MNYWTTRSWTALAAVALCALPLRAQGDEKKQDPEVATKLETFDDAIKDKKFEHDQEAVQIVDELLKGYPSMHPKDQKDVRDALESVFRQKPRKPEQPALYKATVFALGAIGGEEASRILVKVFDKKPFDDKDWLSLQEDILENIGRTKDEKQIEFLVKRATRDPTDGIMRAAGKALRHFEGCDLKKRQGIFKDLLTTYGKIEGDSKGSLDPNDATVATRKRTLAAIADPWNQTLAALSGQSYRTAEEWYKWWNEAKNNAKLWK